MGLLDYIWGDTEEQKEARLEATPFKTKHRSCTDVCCLVLYIFAVLGWIAVAVVAFLDGNPEKILYPTDSSGNVCGHGEYQDRPMMFMFDISRCAGLATTMEGCPTPSICVAQCPDTEWSYKDGKVDMVRQYCYSMTDVEWETQTIEDLVTLRLCPAYLVKQRPLFDRCLPSFVNGNGGNVTNSSLFDNIDHAHNLTSRHDGRHSNYTVTFVSDSDSDDINIVSIHGYVKKFINESEGEADDYVIAREKRSVDDNNDENSIFADKIESYEYNEIEEYNISDIYDSNTTKRDLTDAIDMETLKEGVEKLKQILDLTSLSEKLIWDLSVYWWILLLFLLLAFVLSFIWIG